ncbi:MAG: dihydroorotate dehydrogenase B catalytic subunit [Thermofilum sp. ex4484_79]|nr:MAG: dihydroorotate dehydrogenase B catalytic subunit [Thermofilum sp. ex4484_79]
MSLSLVTSLGDIKLKNPFILASGILDLAPSLFLRAAKSGAGAIVTKTITMNERKGFENPVIVEVPCGFINSMGLPNPGIEYFIEHCIKGIDKKIDVPIILSLGPSSREDIEIMMDYVERSSIEIIEINASCPHVKGHGLTILEDEATLGEIIRTVKRRLQKGLVLVKISALVSNLVKVADVIFSSGADGIVAINTLKAIAIDIWSKKPILGGIYGGLSGPAIKHVALRCIYELYESFPDKIIIGVGGITSWEDAVEFFLAGASAVQIGSAVAVKGLEIFKELAKGVSRYLKDEGYSSLEEIIGLAHNF